MTKLLRSHFYRLFHSGILLVALLVILAVDLFFSSRCPVTTTNMYELPRLTTMGQFMSYAENSTMSVSTAKAFFKKRGQLEESDATSITPCISAIPEARYFSPSSSSYSWWVFLSTSSASAP